MAPRRRLILQERKQMNRKLALQAKEDLLEILDWSNNDNRKLAVQCIGEISERLLEDINVYLKEEEKKANNVNWCVKCDHHLSKCECDLDCEDANRSDDCSHCCETLETKGNA